MPCRVAPRRDLEVGLDLERRLRKDSLRRQRSVIAAPPVLRRDPPARPRDRGDAPVPEREQMAHRLVGSGCMRGRDRRHALVERQPRIDDDEPVALFEQTCELVARLLRQHDQCAVGHSMHEPVEQRDLTVVLVLRGGENDAELLLVQ